MKTSLCRASGRLGHRDSEEGDQSHCGSRTPFLPPFAARWGRDGLASAGKASSRGWGDAPESAAELPGAQAASAVGEGVGLGLQRLGKPCGDLGGGGRKAWPLAPSRIGPLGTREGACEPTPWAPLASSFSSPLLTTGQRDPERTPEKDRPKGKERGERASQTGVRRTTPFSLVTSGNSQRWRQALLAMCVKNARLEKLVASKVPPLSRGGWPTKEVHFHPPLAHTSESGGWGLGGTQGRLGTVLASPARTHARIHIPSLGFLNPLGPETSIFSFPFHSRKLSTQEGQKNILPKILPPSKQGQPNSLPSAPLPPQKKPPPRSEKCGFGETSDPDGDLR